MIIRGEVMTSYVKAQVLGQLERNNYHVRLKLRPTCESNNLFAFLTLP